MENLVKSKIRAFYPDADFSSISSGDIVKFKELIQERLTKSQLHDNIAHVEVNKIGFIFDKTKEPCLEFEIKLYNENNQIFKRINLVCYAFDIVTKDGNDEKLHEILLRSWHKLMISKFKRDYCDGLSNYILSWRVRNGEQVAETACKALKEVMIEKYSIKKEETNQP